MKDAIYYLEKMYETELSVISRNIDKALNEKETRIIYNCRNFDESVNLINILTSHGYEVYRENLRNHAICIEWGHTTNQKHIEVRINAEDN